MRNGGYDFSSFDWSDVQSLKSIGFLGFVPVRKLQKDSNPVPDASGLFIVVRLAEASPEFLRKGSCGKFKGKDPNVFLEELKSRWIDNTVVLYIGCSSNIRKRLKDFVNAGKGEANKCWGARLLWQIKGSQDFLLAWMPTGDGWEEMKRQCIQAFKGSHGGKQPFANIKFYKK